MSRQACEEQPVRADDKAPLPIGLAVAVAARLFDAVLVTENLTDMVRWQDQLIRLKRTLVLHAPLE